MEPQSNVTMSTKKILLENGDCQEGPMSSTLLLHYPNEASPFSKLKKKTKMLRYEKCKITNFDHFK